MNAARTIYQYKHTAWTAENGAPTNVQTITQTSDGYLWLASAATGVYRFDGVRFERLERTLEASVPTGGAFGLWAPPTGGLWVGWVLGGATFIKDGHAVTYGQDDGLAGGSSITCFAIDAEGVLWAGSGHGLARFDGQRWHMAPVEASGKDSGADYFSEPVNYLHKDRSGTLWVEGERSLAAKRPGSPTFVMLKLQGENPQIADAPDGTLFQSDGTLGIRVLGHLGDVSFTPGPWSVPTGAGVPVSDRDGGLWMSTTKGLIHTGTPQRFAATTPRAFYENFDTSSGLTGQNVFNVFEDREGNLWLGTDGGIDRFREAALVRVPTEPLKAFFAVGLGASDSVWIGSSTPRLLQVTDDEVKERPWKGGRVSCLLGKPTGELWIGATNGLYHRLADRWTQVPLPPELILPGSIDVQAMARDGGGALWVAFVNHGLYRLDGAQWAKWSGRDGLPEATPTSAAADPQGRVWLGYSRNRLARIDGTRVSMFDSPPGFDVGHTLAITPAGGHVWFGGEHGLFLYDGTRFRPIAATPELSLATLTGIVETPDGDLWTNGGGGITHIAAGELARQSRHHDYVAQATPYDIRDGLPGPAGAVRPLPTALQDARGRLWFATENAVVWVDPRALPRNTVIPPTWIQSINGTPRASGVGTDAVFAPLTRSLQIQYTAPSLTIPERVRFRYKLEGSDPDWQDAGDRRTAFYTNLGPGRYRFRVLAANDAGLWNERGDSVEFTIQPAFFQTHGFYAACALLAGVLLWLLSQLRMRRLSAQMRRRLEERLTERERIARDLHDTLLQGMQGMIYTLHVETERLPAGEPGRAHILRALDRADDVLAEGRDQVMGIRSHLWKSPELSQALTEIAESNAKGRRAALRVTVQGQVRELHPVVREEMYRIGSEALANAYAHADAAHIELELLYDRRECGLRVRDDGIGIDERLLESRSQSGHFGLRGMQERAKKIQGRLDIWTRPHLGTEIALKVPASLAYRHPLRRWRIFQRLRRGAPP